MSPKKMLNNSTTHTHTPYPHIYNMIDQLKLDLDTNKPKLKA